MTLFLKRIESPWVKTVAKVRKALNSGLKFKEASLLFNKARYNFATICQLYKSILDSSRRFCTDGHCKTVFMVEIKFDGNNWGTSPKIFYSEAEANVEVELLKLKYPFLSGCRVVTRQIEEKEKKS